MVICKSANCNKKVTKKGHFMCYDCWKMHYSDGSSRKTAASSSTDEMLSATKIGQEFEISGQKLNLLLNELGWTYKPRHGKGWSATKQGKRQGAEARKVKTSGVPYIVWPSKITRSKVLRRAVADFKGEPLPNQWRCSGSRKCWAGTHGTHMGWSDRQALFCYPQELALV